jgi:hypothetical protein
MQPARKKQTSTTNKNKTKKKRTNTMTNKRNLIINGFTWITLLLTPNSEVKPFLIVAGAAATMHTFPIRKDDDSEYRNSNIWNEYTRMFPSAPKKTLTNEELDEIDRQLKEDLG